MEKYSTPVFSLVLATFGRSDELARAIRSFADQTFKDFEILVVDQNQDDRILTYIELARMLGLSVQHIKMDFPNLSVARNIGIENSKGRLVAFPDDDCWYEPNLLESVIKATANDLDSGAVIQWVEQADANAPVRAKSLSASATRSFRDIPASSIAIFIPRKFLTELHGFNPNMGVGRWYGAGEETDLMIRLLDLDVKMPYVPDARVHHHFSKLSHRKMSWQSTRKRARGTGALYVKNRINPFIVLRGFISPLVKPILQLDSLKSWFFGFAILIGRIEGLVGWLFHYKR